MDHLASLYIDNELNLDEKTQFVDMIHSDRPFYHDTRMLLDQEKLLRTVPDTSSLPDRPLAAVERNFRLRRIIRPLIFSSAGFAVAVLLLVTIFSTPDPSLQISRFVIYEPSARKVELTGSFSGWQRIPMIPAGPSGYWHLNLPVPSGEHRFAYIIDSSRRIADPTLSVREQDDFGGENSILKVEGRV